jgi:hypothetical protein
MEKIMEEPIRPQQKVKVDGAEIKTEEIISVNKNAIEKLRKAAKTKRKYKRNKVVDAPVSEKELNKLLEKEDIMKSWPVRIQLKIRLWLRKFWSNVHHPIKQNWFTLFFIIAFTMMSTMIITKVFFPSRSNQQEFGMLAKLETLKQSHDYYTSMATKDEMLMSWVKLFSNWRYSVGGDPRYNNGDCVGAVHEFFKQWNSNITFEDIDAIIRRGKSLEDRGEMKRRTAIADVHNGDLIIFDFGNHTPKHVGVVYDQVNGLVRYMDVNGYTLTWGLERVRFGDKSIHAIYEVSYSFWIGNLMQEINKKK